MIKQPHEDQGTHQTVLYNHFKLFNTCIPVLSGMLLALHDPVNLPLTVKNKRFVVSKLKYAEILNSNLFLSKTLTAARRVGALRTSFPGVFFWSYLARDDDIDEVSGCDGRLSVSPKLFHDAGLWRRDVVLQPDA